MKNIEEPLWKNMISNEGHPPSRDFIAKSFAVFLSHILFMIGRNLGMRGNVSQPSPDFHAPCHPHSAAKRTPSQSAQGHARRPRELKSLRRVAKNARDLANSRTVAILNTRAAVAISCYLGMHHTGIKAGYKSVTWTVHETLHSNILKLTIYPLTIKHVNGLSFICGQ